MARLWLTPLSKKLSIALIKERIQWSEQKKSNRLLTLIDISAYYDHSSNTVLYSV